MSSPLRRIASTLRSLRPTWRQGFLMLATFVLGSAALFTLLYQATPRDDAALVPAWFNLLEDCRTSLESRAPLFGLGLLPTGTQPDPLRFMGMSRTKMWAPLGGGRFAVMEHEHDTQTGVLRGCDVVLADWHRPLSRLEIDRLTFAFLEQRTRLLYQGSHAAHDIDPRADYTSAGYRSKAPNPADCQVVTAMFAEPDKGEFSVLAGEQLAGQCTGGASFIKSGQ